MIGLLLAALLAGSPAAPPDPAVATTAARSDPRAAPSRGDPDAELFQDQELLEKEHRAMVETIGGVLKSPQAQKKLGMLYGVALHDVYHAGQIRLLRRLQER